MVGSFEEKVNAAFHRQEILDDIEVEHKYINMYDDIIKGEKDKNSKDALSAKECKERLKEQKKEHEKELKALDKKWGVDILPLTDYEEDAMWMSYRYAVGRNTIAAHYHPNGIYQNCFGRLTKERTSFTAFDIDREIQNSLCWRTNTSFHFQLLPGNDIVMSAIDAYCTFIEQENITTIDQLSEYKTIYVDFPYKYDENGNYVYDKDCRPVIDVSIRGEKYEGKHKKLEYFDIMGIEDLFVWNDLVHIFDIKKHRKARLKDGTITTYCWTWTKTYGENEDGTRKELSYKRIRIPVYDWNTSCTKWLPDESIVEELDE